MPDAAPRVLALILALFLGSAAKIALMLAMVGVFAVAWLV